MGVLDTFSLAGKVSVVTGANRGIGRALAGALADAGLARIVEHRTAAVRTEPMLPRLPLRVSLEKALSKSSSRGKANLVKNLPQR